MTDEIPSPKIALSGVRKQFGDKVVLDGIDLEVGRAESLVVIGGSGTGKSVMLKSILGLLRPEAGSILVANYLITGLFFSK